MERFIEYKNEKQNDIFNFNEYTLNLINNTNNQNENQKFDSLLDSLIEKKEK